MPYRLDIHPDRCIACRSCELACALENENLMATNHSRIVLISLLENSGEFGRLPYNYPSACRQCADAPCLDVCPENAIAMVRDDGGGVKIFRQLCTGCGKCTVACPFGSIHLDLETKIAVKCELCDGKPACVLVCPSKAIQFKPSEDYYARIPAFKMEVPRLLKQRNKKIRIPK